MKTFNEYINEKQNFIFGGKAGLSGKEYKQKYTYRPKDDEELNALMEKLRKERGGDGDFNDIDTSSVTVMSYIFERVYDFNGDISLWDTSKVTNMHNMFFYAESFNQDISHWDTSKVTNMHSMFAYAKKFNQDISNWNVSKIVKVANIFYGCPIKEEYKPKFKK